MEGASIASGAKALDDSDALSQAVSGDEGGIGFVALPFVKDAKALAIRDGDAAALTPSTLSVSTEEYALSRRLYLYTPEHPASAMAIELVQFASSDEGQRIIAQEGFVPISVVPTTTQLPQNAPDDYKKLVANARRLPFNLHFRPKTSNLDGKALSDIGRAAAWWQQQGARGTLYMIGFADKSGPEPQNVSLSRDRAKKAADALTAKTKANVAAYGFGSELPIAPNDTAEGRERNRRVEVWISSS